MRIVRAGCAGAIVALAACGGTASTPGGVSGRAGGGGGPSSAGTGGSGGGTGGATPPPAGTCSLDFTVTTVTANGDYAPYNVGAIWIEDGAGTFVKTLAYWGNIRLRYLLAWKQASGGNRVDAVSSATLLEHGTHEVSWNCTDANEQLVRDGGYQMHVEFTEQDSSLYGYPPAGPTTSIPFDVGATPESLAPQDQANFVGMHLVYTPPGP